MPAHGPSHGSPQAASQLLDRAPPAPFHSVAAGRDGPAPGARVKEHLQTNKARQGWRQGRGGEEGSDHRGGKASRKGK